MKARAAFTLSLALLFSAGALGEPEAAAQERRYPESPAELIGDPLPELRVRPVRRGTPEASVDPAQQRGQVVVLTFLASWCHNCRRLSPVLAELHACSLENVAGRKPRLMQIFLR